MNPARRTLLALALLALAPSALRAEPDPADWEAVLAEARGQTVRFHAWGGSTRVNDYLLWVAAELDACCGVRLVQVKVADIAETVSRILAEKAAGRTEGGAVDLVWINGENFAAMKRHGLLHGPFADRLPNWRFADIAGKPALTADFTVPTEGYESPWGLAQLVFFHDAARLADPPLSMPALLDWARAAPGRFAYPAPPDFIGTTFLKQALHELTPDPAALARAPEATDLAAATAPLWAYLDALHPHLWRQGRAWPQNGPRLKQMMADGEIDLAMAFDPNEAASAIANRELPQTVRAYVLEGGTIANAHFVAIPFNASAKAGAMAAADFLLSPTAQARKADPAIWGSATVLDLAALAPGERALFDAIPRRPGAVDAEALGRSLPEPHPGWVAALEAEWARRYGSGN